MSAPGYQSQRWINQDWRFIRMSFQDGEPVFTFEKKCGSKGTRYPNGNARLCLPNQVIKSLIRSKRGTESLRIQVRKKQRANPGERVAYEPLILERYKAFQKRDKFIDDKRFRGRGIKGDRKTGQLRLF